jgi:hypothetical protein
MIDLAQQVRTFLEAEGYTVSSRRELFVGSRRTLAEDTEYIYVWVPANYVPNTFASREAGFLSRFDEVVRANPTASKFIVVPTLEGLSRQFRDGVLQWYRRKGLKIKESKKERFVFRNHILAKTLKSREKIYYRLCVIV